MTERTQPMLPDDEAEWTAEDWQWWTYRLGLTLDRLVPLYGRTNRQRIEEAVRLALLASAEPETREAETAAEWFNAYQQVNDYLIERVSGTFELPYQDGGQSEMVANTIAMIEALLASPAEPETRSIGKIVAWLPCCSGPLTEDGSRLHFEGCTAHPSLTEEAAP